MPALLTNPDLPLSWRRPGTYVYINTNSPGNGAADISKRVLILGERNGSGAQLAANAIYQAPSEQTVIDNSGQGSPVHLAYRAALSQIGPGVADVFVGHVDQNSGGTAAVWGIYISGTATGAGQFDMYVAGQKASVGFASGDDPTAIGGALLTELNKLGNVPCTFSHASGVITVTHRQKAAHGEDVPFMFYITPSKGVSVGAGDAVFATNAVGAGSVRIKNGTTSISATVNGADTPSTIASAINTAINATDGPLTSSVSTATLSVFFVNNKVIRRTSLKIITSTGTTINWNSSGAVAAGTEAPAGTPGLGSPTLTTLLNNIDALGGFGRWVCPWTDTSTIGTIATAIEDEGSGLKQKNQVLHICSTDTQSNAGAIPTGTAPALTSSLRYAVHRVPDAPQMGYEFAARTAAARAANDRPARNWDHYALKTVPGVPLMAAPPGQRATSAELSSDINTYFLSPIRYSDSAGKWMIEFGRTTSNSSDRVLHDWSCIDQLDKQRAEIIDRMNGRFFTDQGGVSYMRSGTPFSEGIIDLAAIEDFQYELTVDWERRGFYDGADALKAGIKATPDLGDASRVDLVYTASVIVPIHQISVVENRGSAAQ